MIYRQGYFVFEAHAGPQSIRVNVSYDTEDKRRGLICRGVLQFPLDEWERFKSNLNLKEEHGTHRG